MSTPASLSVSSLFSVAGKVAVVTGGSRGIGEMIAAGLLANGAKVYISSRKAEQCDATAARLSETYGGECISVPADLSGTEGIDALVAAVSALEDHVDILVNNAGKVSFSSFESCSESDWNEIIDTNLKGTFLCSQAILPHMKARSSGVIINLSSLAGKTGGLATSPAYAAAKAGVSSLTFSLARTLAPHGVRAVGISPGIIDTPMTASPAHDHMKSQIPLGKVGQAEDVANCALFLASEEARHITGEIIDVNGGLYMD